MGRISELTAMASQAATDLFAFAQSGVRTFRETRQQLADWIIKTSASFLQSGAGAVARTMQDKARDIVSVKDFGALGDNSNDDTAAIQAAVDSLGAAGGIVYIPKGTYKLSSQILVTAPIIFVGAGMEATILRQTGATANGINFNYASLQTGGGVFSLTIEAGAGWKTGGLTTSGSTGVGLRVKAANDNFVVSDVSIHNFDTGANLIYCWNTRWRSFRILFCTTDGLRIDLDGANIGGGNHFAQGKLSNNGFTGTNTGSCGVRVKASGGEEFTQVDISSFNQGFVVNPATGSEQVLYLFCHQVLADTCLNDGWFIDGSAKIVWSIHCHDCWSGFNSGPGLRVRGANLSSVRWIGGRLRENAKHGAHLESGVNLAIVGAEIASNSRGNSGTYHGVQIDADVDEWGLLDCRVGNYASTFSHQQNGVNIAAGTSENFRIVGNDLRGNLNLPIVNGTSSANFVIADNMPRATNGANATERVLLTGGSATAPAAGSTSYLGPAGAMTNATDAPFVTDKAGVITRFFVATVAAPGAGETFTYTIMKNGVAQTMAGTISGAASFGVTVTTNPVAIAANDAIALRLVVSGAGAATAHRFSITLEQ